MSDLKTFNGAITNVRTQEYLKQVLGTKAGAFVANVTSVVANDAKLQACEPYTLMYAALKATSLDLPLDQNLGFAYIIPYKNNKAGTTEAQFQLGYRAFVQMAERSSQYKHINVREVREGDEIDKDFLCGKAAWEIKHGAARLDKPIIGYVAYFELINGFEKELFWTTEQVRQHGLRYSQTFSSKTDYIRNNSKWATDFDAMAKKTVLKNLLSKWGMLSVDMQNAFKYDQAVIRGDFDGTEKVDYVDNQKTAGTSTAAFPKIGETQPQPIEDAQVVESATEQTAEPKKELFD